MSSEPQAEIWFYRWQWSYLPCHWKGWAIMGGTILVVLVVNLLLLPALVTLSEDGQNIAFFVSIVLAIVLMEIVARKHMRPT